MYINYLVYCYTNKIKSYNVCRDLVLFCSQERARLVKKSATLENQNGGSEDDIPFEAEISAFNLFICLVAKYFDQGDLADTDI